MKINSAYAAYYTNMESANIRKNAEQSIKSASGKAGLSTAKKQETDTLELSEVGQKEYAEQLKSLQAGKQSQEMEKKPYDLEKVLAIHEKGFHEIPTREESEYYWEARKNDPELDAMLYAQDKADALEFVGKVQMILMKALSGQTLSSEEEQMVKNDPMLQQEIQSRKAQAGMFL